MTPLGLVLSEGGKTLIVEWPDGRSACIPAEILRAESRSAGAVRAKIDGMSAPVEQLVQDDLSITDVEQVGLYAVNLTFSDGHDRGIYPWAFLRELGEKKYFGN